MSHAGNGRRLRRLEQKSGSKLDPWVEAVVQWGHEHQAALTLVEFARVLAGTDKMQAASLAPSSGDNATETASRVDHAPPRSSRPVWTEAIRPGPHDILTWDEAMRIPWLAGSAEAKQ